MDKSDWLSKMRESAENAFVANDLSPHQDVIEEIIATLCENYPTSDEGHWWELQEELNTFGHEQETCRYCSAIRLKARRV